MKGDLQAREDILNVLQHTHLNAEVLENEGVVRYLVIPQCFR